ncbi:calcium-dependent phosphotriesterase [Penicillium cataractarum]|uniref:Calcium-dependent phosphotriesterase n=1 Tax=Penicillium cataractarum TaxID=2100454 RepID=A0A9W9S1K0_9EURO|nr:calcium-dependent phosphotriesterase [Penicillium cataractarum]KAJ5370266.1 calcium-dependent phosphotriesterase [Penicillium cataractarum]
MARVSASSYHGSIRLLPWAIAALISAIAYRIYLHDTFALIFGFGRVIQPIEDFPWDCKRIQHPLLEGCEDIWLDYNNRKLYGACTSLNSRTGWNPSGSLFNVSARSRTDHISVLNIDEPGVDGLYGLHQLKIDYAGDLDLQGFDVKRIGDRQRFWLINHRPPVDPATGEPLDPRKVGANSTVEIFDLDTPSSTLVHVKTIASEAIISPNNLAVADDGIGFLVTNDHDAKAGMFRDLVILLGGGSLTYCRSDTGKCEVVARKNCSLPNGAVRGLDGRFYVSHSTSGVITVHEYSEDGLVEVKTIPLNVPLDNLSVNKDGNIMVAAIPHSVGFMQAADDPYNRVAAAGVLMLTNTDSLGNNYEVIKVIEDRDAKYLPTTTVAVHDAQTHRLFLAGGFSPFLSICQKRN